VQPGWPLRQSPLLYLGEGVMNNADRSFSGWLIDSREHLCSKQSVWLYRADWTFSDLTKPPVKRPVLANATLDSAFFPGAKMRLFTVLSTSESTALSTGRR
jgi:hypothetical protein